jgi:predicted DsbA family dithiol-disulfide isomerase
MPNTRRALATAEWVRREFPETFPEVHRELFAAQFVTGDPLDDPEVLDSIVTAAGAPAAEVRRAVESGAADAHLVAARDAAQQWGVTSTPSWLVADAMVLPGVFDEATFRRWVGRIVARRVSGRETGR